MWCEIAERRNLLLEDVPPLPSTILTLPQGWLAPLESSILYMAGRELAGPFLEVGSWVGRSTVALAKGLQDRPAGDVPLFDTVDFGITSVEEWRKLLKGDPLGMREAETVLRTIYGRGGSIGELIENLQKYDVLKYVTTIIRGNFLQIPIARTYGFIFCDTLHDEREIELYAPKLAGLLASGGWVVCDDIIDSRRAAMIQEILDLEFYTLTNPISEYTKFLIGRRL